MQATHNRGAGVLTYDNPLADAQQDVEAPGDVMPPVPHLSVDRMLRRAAEHICGKVCVRLVCGAAGAGARACVVCVCVSVCVCVA